MHPHIKKAIDRQLSLGLTHAKWRFVESSTTQCRHYALDGQRFDLRKGLLFEGSMIFPSSRGCRCSHAVEVPGFDGVPPKKPTFIQRLLGVFWRNPRPFH